MGLKRKKRLLGILIFSLVIGMMGSAGGEAEAKKKIILNKKKAVIYVGGQLRLKVKGTKKKVKWSSKEKKIATVSKKGVVKGKRAGKTKITAKVKGKKLVCRLTVKAKKKRVLTTAEATPQGEKKPAPQVTQTPGGTDKPSASPAIEPVGTPTAVPTPTPVDTSKPEPVFSKEDDDTVISFDSEDPASTKTSEKKEEASAVSDDINFDDAISSSDREAFKELLEPQKVPDFNTIINTPEPSTKEEKNKIKKRGLKVIKQEPVVSKKMPKKTPEVVSKTPVKTDATEIKERIENSQNDRQSKNVPPLFNPASASDVKSEYNDTNAPIDLNAFLNGNLSNPTEKQETKEVDDKTKKLTLSQDDNINLMDFLNQIENNDAKVA